MRRALLVLSLAACGRTVSPAAEELVVDGALERDGITGGALEEVALDYDSTGARGEWWPCDLRLTANGCVGDHHVNVYVALPTATDLDAVGTAACVQDGQPQGVYELLHADATQQVGTDVAVFVVVASDTKGDPGALLDDPEETTAASRLVSGTLQVERITDDGAMSLTLEGRTSGDRPVSIAFGGPVRDSSVVPLDGPSTCVDAALKTE